MLLVNHSFNTLRMTDVDVLRGLNYAFDGDGKRRGRRPRLGRANDGDRVTGHAGLQGVRRAPGCRRGRFRLAAQETALAVLAAQCGLGGRRAARGPAPSGKTRHLECGDYRPAGNSWIAAGSTPCTLDGW